MAPVWLLEVGTLPLSPSINQSIKQICIAPCVASESETHTGRH